MLMIQKFLVGGGTFDTLRAVYGITAKRHPAHPNLVHFKYNQIESPMGERIVQECRGIILDEANGWAVVARAFDKFFNYGEGHAATIDWTTARVQEKVDGSIILVYWYAGEWHAASSGTPDGGGNVNGMEFGTWDPMPGCTLPMPADFADYFWQTLARRAPGLFSSREPSRNHCYTFELTGPLNRVVVPHTEARVTLLGARHMETGREQCMNLAHDLLFGLVPAVRSFPLDTIDGVLGTFASMSPLAQEGYVVVDGTFNRIKVKHPGYVALHHAKDGMTTKAFVEIARAGETSEVIAAFPEFKPLLDDAKSKLDGLIAEVAADFAIHKHHISQKDFALAVKSTRCAAALFAVRAGKVPDVRTFFANASIDHVMTMLGYKG